LTRDGREIIWHNGGTGGFRSFIGFERKTGMGVVVLSNAETPEGVDDIGQHLLNADAPLWQPPKEHKPIAVAPKVFDGYVGQYQLAPNFILTVSREGAQSFVQATGQPKVEIFPESDRDYFLKAVDAQITFETEAQGRATGLVLHQNGMNQSAKRLS
jgi:serine-type D-Ala-D-Ala carboxypeptidase/endopeptidase